MSMVHAPSAHEEVPAALRTDEQRACVRYAQEIEFQRLNMQSYQPTMPSTVGPSVREAVATRLCALQQEDGSFEYGPELLVALGLGHCQLRRLLWSSKLFNIYRLAKTGMLRTLHLWQTEAHKCFPISQDGMPWEQELPPSAWGTLIAVTAMQVSLRDQRHVWELTETKAVQLLEPSNIPANEQVLKRVVEYLGPQLAELMKLGLTQPGRTVDPGPLQGLPSV